jgi:hypothetical protein
MLLRDVALDRADVHVGVGEPGHQRAALEVDRVDLAGERAHLAGGDDVLDAVAFHHHRGALDRLLADAVDEERAREYRDRHGGAPSESPR